MKNVLVRVKNSIINRIDRTIVLSSVIISIIVFEVLSMLINNSVISLEKEFLKSTENIAVVITPRTSIQGYYHYETYYEKYGGSIELSNKYLDVFEKNLKELGEYKKVTNQYLSFNSVFSFYNCDSYGKCVIDYHPVSENHMIRQQIMQSTSFAKTNLQSAPLEIPDEDFFRYNVTIDGRYFNENELNGNKMIGVLNISGKTPKFVDKNSLEIIDDFVAGDTYTLSITSDFSGTTIINEYEIEIIGIVSQQLFTNAENAAANSLIVPENTFKRIMDETYQIIRNYDDDRYLSVASTGKSLSAALYKLESYDDVLSFCDKVDELNIFENNIYKYETTIDSYASSVGYLKSVASSMKILTSFGFVTTVFISLLILLLDINRRRKEWAILISMGESKKHIIIQIVLEYIIIYLLSTIIGITISKLVFNRMSIKVFNEELLIKLFKSLDNINLKSFSKFNTFNIVLIILSNLIFALESLLIGIFRINKISIKEDIDSE